jgi:hypothetical protein
VQVAAEAQETPVRKLSLAFAALGLGTTDQVVPFHDSIRVLPIPLPSVSAPTAVHAAAETQDTAVRTLLGSDAGLGLGTSDHFRACAPATAGPGRALPLAPAAKATTTPTAAATLTTGHRNIRAAFDAERLCIATPLEVPGIQVPSPPRPPNNTGHSATLQRGARQVLGRDARIRPAGGRQIASWAL